MRRLPDEEYLRLRAARLAAREKGPQIDLSWLECPKCGFSGCTVLQMPDTKTWFGRLGKAKCDHCRVTFNIQAIDEE